MRPENQHMKAFLAHHGIKARVEYIRKGSMKGSWHLTLDHGWTADIVELFSRLGFTGTDHGPLLFYPCGYVSTCKFVCGHDELVNSPPVFSTPPAPPLPIIKEQLPAPETETSLDKAAAIILQAKEMWRQRCADFFAKHGDRGCSILGAGIAVKFLYPRCRIPRNRIIIYPEEVSRWQGECVWANSAGEIVTFLKENGLPSAFFESGHMD